jgi:hypothetical protein
MKCPGLNLRTSVLTDASAPRDAVTVGSCGIGSSFPEASKKVKWISFKPAAPGSR